MTVPTTNMTFGSIQTEFGGTNPILASEYYRGGNNVPSSATSAYGTIPTSGQISMGVFRGTQKAVLLDTQTIVLGYAASTYVAAIGYERGSIGTINDGTSNVYGGALIQQLSTRATPVNNWIDYFAVSGDRDGTWNSIKVIGPSYNRYLYRANASRSYSGGITSWIWSPSPAGAPDNGTFNQGTGTTLTVEFYS